MRSREVATGYRDMAHKAQKKRNSSGLMRSKSENRGYLDRELRSQPQTQRMYAPHRPSSTATERALYSDEPARRMQRGAECAQSRTSRHEVFNPHKEIRIVLLGKTGNGKSASGNTILDQEAFLSVLSPCSETSECKKARGDVDGQKVAVIDTPGIYDTKYKEEEVVRKLRECISLSAPGPHVFLIVVTLGRFTEEEQKTVQLLQKIFGEKSADYTMVLFTHGDRLKEKPVEDFFRKSPQLNHLIQKCNRRYHVFDNTIRDRGQVSELLVKIISMVEFSGRGYYTTKHFQEAEKAIQERTEQIMKDDAGRKNKHLKKLREMFKGEQLQVELVIFEKKFAKKSREKAEKKNRFTEAGLVLTTAEVGLAIGAAATAAGGPLCIAAGAVVGGLTGVLVGLFAPAAAKALKEKCVIQ